MKVWTNLSSGGTNAGGPSCSFWESFSGTGIIGEAGTTGAEWTQSTTQACNQPGALYCFQDFR